LSNSSRPSRDCAVGKLSVVLTSLERAPSTDLRSSRKRHSASLDDLGFARVALQMPGLRGARRVFRPAGAPNVSDLPGPEGCTGLTHAAERPSWVKGSFLAPGCLPALARVARCDTASSDSHPTFRAPWSTSEIPQPAGVPLLPQCSSPPAQSGRSSRSAAVEDSHHLHLIPRLCRVVMCPCQLVGDPPLSQSTTPHSN
jgi:hypothetical protein